MGTSRYRTTLRHLAAWLSPMHNLCVALLTLLLCLSWAPAWGQSGFEDDRVMLQGFYWESYRHGHPDKFPTYGMEQWYGIVKQQANRIREGRFDLIWLPPPSYA